MRTKMIRYPAIGEKVWVWLAYRDVHRPSRVLILLDTIRVHSIVINARGARAYDVAEESPVAFDLDRVFGRKNDAISSLCAEALRLMKEIDLGDPSRRFCIQTEHDGVYGSLYKRLSRTAFVYRDVV